MLPIIGGIRPNAPVQWPFSRAASFSMARHHILPYNTLQDVWNRLVRSLVDTELAEARVAARQFLTMCNRKLTNIDTLLEQTRRGQLTVVDCTTMEESAVWAPWNIVDGPNRRSDDPGDSYVDRFTFGITPEEFSRMAVIERLYLTFEQFSRVAQPDEAEFRMLVDSVSVARMSLGFVERPIPFRPEMWEREADGRWHKRRSGEQFLKAAAR